MNGPKIILMPLGTGGEARERLDSALLVAQAFDAHLQVLHTRLSPNSIVPAEVFVMSRQAQDSLKEIFEQHTSTETEKLQALFKQACDAKSITETDNLMHPGFGASWLETQGLRSGLVARFGKAADLILIARPPEGKPTASFEAAVLETGRPVMVIPRKLKDFSLNTITIGWNGSAEASSSIAHAIPLLKTANRVAVASTEKRANERPGLTGICDYLKVHDVHAEQHLLNTKGKYKDQALLEKAQTLNSDLIVLGAYSKRRLHESVFGGVTQYMLAHSDRSLFFSH